jgi:general secretion pathway protein K
MGNAMTRQRGAALLVVLWALAFLAVLMGGVVAVVRLENQQSRHALDRSHALISAEAGLALAVEGLLEPTVYPLVADGRDYEALLDGVKVAFSVRSERGKLDINFADTQAFTRLLLYLGASRTQTVQLSEQLRSFRTAGRFVKFLEQVQAFDGMDSELYQKLEPNITLWTGLTQPDKAFATPDVRAALGLPNQLTASQGPGSVVSVSARGQLPNGFIASLNVTLHLDSAGGGAPLYRVLRWQE